MKQEIIEALCNTLAPTTPTDPRERGRLANLFMAFGKRNGPSISGADLARLVDLRLRQRKDSKKIETREVVEEIESTLDLVELCEFMLEVRRGQSGKTQSMMFNLALENRLTDQEKQIKAAIERESYPLDFHKGLIRMGVPGDSAKERESLYWQYFKSPYANGQVQHPEDDLKRCYEEQTQGQWENAHDLLASASQWLRWWKSEKSKKKSAAGKESGKARKQRSASKK